MKYLLSSILMLATFVSQASADVLKINSSCPSLSEKISSTVTLSCLGSEKDLVTVEFAHNQGDKNARWDYSKCKERPDTCADRFSLYEPGNKLFDAQDGQLENTMYSNSSHIERSLECALDVENRPQVIFTERLVSTDKSTVFKQVNAKVTQLDQKHFEISYSSNKKEKSLKYSCSISQ